MKIGKDHLTGYDPAGDGRKKILPLIMGGLALGKAIVGKIAGDKAAKEANRNSAQMAAYQTRMGQLHSDRNRAYLGGLLSAIGRPGMFGDIGDYQTGFANSWTMPAVPAAMVSTPGWGATLAGGALSGLESYLGTNPGRPVVPPSVGASRPLPSMEELTGGLTLNPRAGIFGGGGPATQAALGGPRNLLSYGNNANNTFGVTFPS